MEYLCMNSTLGSTPVKAQSLTLKQTCASGLVNKAVADTSTSLFLFASVKRSDPKAQPAMIRVVACSEREARRELAPRYVLSLAARLPNKEARHDS